MSTVFHILVKTGIDVINILDSFTYNLGPHIPGIIASYIHVATTWRENTVDTWSSYIFPFWRISVKLTAYKIMYKI